MIDINNSKSAFLNRMHKSYMESSSKKASDTRIEATKKTENPTYSLIFNDVATVSEKLYSFPFRTKLITLLLFLECSPSFWKTEDKSRE